MFLRTRGMGDWFDPACTPGAPGCVPHWYCYIPGMATPDCFSSFVEGTRELTAGAGSAVGQTVGAAVGGAATGIVSGAVGGFVNNDSSGPIGSLSPWAWLGIGLAGLFALSTLAQPGPRRYGR